MHLIHQMSSPFQKYWNKLKSENPTLYEEKLKKNRDRIQEMRKKIYDDPEKHKLHKEKMRLAYARRKNQKEKTE